MSVGSVRTKGVLGRETGMVHNVKTTTTTTTTPIEEHEIRNQKSYRTWLVEPALLVMSSHKLDQ